MKVSDYIVKMATGAGIRDVFLVTGGGAMHLDDSFGHCPDLHCTFHHHEQACSMAAEAYARVENRPACVVVTTGPGASNALTGVLCAYMESIPMLVISGQARYATTVRSTGLALRTMGIQEFDIVRSAEPMTKYAVMITRPEDVRYAVEKALSLMMSGRRGPVWLDVPLDVQAAEIDPGSLRAYDPDENPEEKIPCPGEGIADVILEKLRSAERPVLFGGYGVRAAGGTEEFRKLAELLGIPVLTGMSSQDLVEEDYPLFAGRTGMTGQRSGNLAMAGCDLFLSLGSRLSFLQTGFDYEEWAREAFVIMNDIDPLEFRKPNIRADLPVICDALALMRELNARLLAAGASKEHPFCTKAAGWLQRCLERKHAFPPVTDAMKGPQKDGRANLYAFVDALSDELQDGDQVIFSCGQSRFAGTQAYRLGKEQRFYTNSATASMGYDLPASIGIARASGKPVNLVTGDGSLMMNLQEMQTIRTNRLPVRVFLICNDGYHSIRQTQNAYFGKPLVGIGPESGDLDFPEPEGIAQLFGFTYAKCGSNETLKRDLREAMKLPLPALIEISATPLQGSEPKASSRRLPDGTMVSVPLEDMAPFLPRDVLAANLEIPLTINEAKR